MMRGGGRYWWVSGRVVGRSVVVVVDRMCLEKGRLGCVWSFADSGNKVGLLLKAKFSTFSVGQCSVN